MSTTAYGMAAKVRRSEADDGGTGGYARVVPKTISSRSATRPWSLLFRHGSFDGKAGIRARAFDSEALSEREVRNAKGEDHTHYDA